MKASRNIDPDAGASKRRVAHLLGTLQVGGKERVAIDLATRSQRSGWDARIVLFDEPVLTESDDHFDPGGVPWTHMPRGPGLDLRFIRALRRWILAQRVSVLHAHNDSALVYAACATRFLRARRPRIVATFHTRPSHPTRAGRLLCRWASRRADSVCAVSPDLRTDLLTTRWVSRCDVVWNGIDTDAWHAEGPTDGWRELLGIEPDTLFVGHVGRFHPVKRQRDLLSAIREVRRQGVEATLVLAGDGPDRAAFEGEAGGDSFVHVVPRVRRVPEFMRELDLFALSSSEEAAPMVLLEAMACAIPCVATDAGSVAEILGVGTNAAGGVLVPVGCPDELAAAIAALGPDPERRAELGRNARQRVVSCFSLERAWAAYEPLYSGGAQRP